MPASPNQPDPKEAVEAQLCAYLEGELSPAERAGIDRHLSDHPQHRQLLADLGRNRQWLRDLPRERAPAEVGEAYQQQVERSLLLGEDGAATSARPGTGRWPQRVLLAALVVLTVGLGLLVTLMLAPPRHGQVAVELPAPEPPRLVPGPTADQHSAEAKALPSSRNLAAADAVGGPRLPGTASVASTAPAAEPRVADAVPNAATAAASPAVRPPVVAASVPAGGRVVRVRVLAADPAAVGTYLLRSGLRLDGGPADPQTDSAAASTPTRSPAGNAARRGVTQDPAAVQHPASPGEYVVDGLTSAQVTQLVQDLKTAGVSGRGTVEVLTRPPSAADRVIAAGDQFVVTIPQLVGPGVTQANAVRVAPEGTIPLPMIAAVPVAGATPAEAARRVEARYRTANLIPNPTATLTAVVPAVVPGRTEKFTVVVNVESR